MHHVQCTLWTLQFSHSCCRNPPFFLPVPTAQGEAVIFLLHPLNCFLIYYYFFFKASFQILCLAGSESVATKHGPWHKDSAALPRGREQPALLALSLISARKSLWDCQQVILLSCAIGNHCYLTRMMWGLTCCASYGKGGPWMEGPTDEQRIIAVSGCDST